MDDIASVGPTHIGFKDVGVAQIPEVDDLFERELPRYLAGYLFFLATKRARPRLMRSRRSKLHARNQLLGAIAKW